LSPAAFGTAEKSLNSQDAVSDGRSQQLSAAHARMVFMGSRSGLLKGVRILHLRNYAVEPAGVLLGVDPITGV
jgi:hypothetical protein